MKKTLGISFFFILLMTTLNSTLHAQNKTIKGVIIDADTKETLAFVNVLSGDESYGTSTDIDGKFKINIPTSINKLSLSYVGYESISIDILKKKAKYVFRMKKKAYLLSELEITPGSNPAHRIIRNVIQYRDTNNPEKLQSYSYTSYDKMLITLDIKNTEVTDSVLFSNDTIESLSTFIEDKDILLMENIVEKKFLAPDRSHEKVIASKVSGLKDPLIVFVVSQIQSTSFYDEIIHMVNKNYINPISKGTFNKYFFHLEDTTYSAEGDTIFAISYQPYSNKNFDALRGVLNISTKKWAIVNVRAEPVDVEEQGFDIEIQQQYEYIEGHWFPTQLNTNLIFTNMIAASEAEKATFIGIGKSYHKNIELNPELVKKQFSYIEVELDPNAGYRDDEYWNKYRSDTLSARDKRTYNYMDSVGQAENFDKSIKQLETVLTGKIPWGKFDIPLDKFFGYNSYEGFWLGAGIRTNKRLNTKWDIGAYGAYAFRAQKAKYGIDGNLQLYKPWAMSLYAKYSRDFVEAAGQNFYDNQQNVLSPDHFKDYFVSRSNYTDSKEIALRFRTLRYMHASIGLAVENKEAAYDYFYQDNSSLIEVNEFNFTELRIGIRYAYKEKFFDNSRMLLSMGTKYPIIWFNYYQGFKNFLGGEYNYQRFDIKIQKSFYTKYLGETSIILNGGIVLGDVPYSNLYRGQGTNGVITMFAPGSFGSMGSAEFLSDRYFAAFFSHNFGNLLYQGEKFKPELVLLTNIGFGWLSHPEYHKNIAFKTMNLGYYESGFLINRLLNLKIYNIGIGATYRYGPYSNNLIEDNLSIKISLTFPFKPSFTPVD
jgi:hypothetical protein